VFTLSESFDDECEVEEPEAECVGFLEATELSKRSLIERSCGERRLSSRLSLSIRSFLDQSRIGQPPGSQFDNPTGDISLIARHKIPSALTPAAKTIRPVAATGIDVLDALLAGGLSIGAVTELIGPDCSGRTSVAASFLARMTRASKVPVSIPFKLR
jgi:hypothetical protein